MQLIGITLRNIKSEYSLSTRYRYSSILLFVAPLAILLFPTSAIAASERTDADRPAIASATVVHPFSMSASASAASEPNADEIIFSTRTAIRDCAELLGASSHTGSAKAETELCELHLIEFQ